MEGLEDWGATLRHRFTSPVERLKIPGEEDDTENNDEFDVLFFIPDDFFQKVENVEKDDSNKKENHDKNLIILINGMGEFNESVYLGPRGFCQKFKEAGVASVFLPLPFHFNRASDKDQEITRENKKAPIVRKIYNHKQRFYLGFEQIREDVLELTNIVYASLGNDLPGNTKVSLWGFSIGGLGVMSCFFNQPERFNSCVLVHSGANFETLGYDENLLKEYEWEEVRKYYLEERFKKDIQSTRKDCMKSFEGLFLGKHEKAINDLIQEWTHKILFFIGGLDQVSPIEGVTSSLKPASGLAIHTLPGLQHDNLHKAFRNWVAYEIGVVKTFLELHPDKPGEKSKKGVHASAFSS